MGNSGMAPTPEQMLALRNANIREQENSEGAGAKSVLSPPLTAEVRAIMHSLFWQYQKRILDLVEVSTPSDRQWAILRKAIQNVQAEQLESMIQAVTRKIFDNQEKLNGKLPVSGN